MIWIHLLSVATAYADLLMFDSISFSEFYLL